MICATHFQRGQQFAVVIIEHVVLDPDAASGLLRFRAPALGQNPAALLVMAGVAVGDGDELHLMPGGGVFGGEPACLAITIVGVSSKRDDAQLGIVLGKNG